MESLAAPLRCRYRWYYRQEVVSNKLAHRPGQADVFRHNHLTGIDFTVVDSQGESHFTRRAIVTTIAAMRALTEQRSPDEIPEFKRTLEREFALELARALSPNR